MKAIKRIYLSIILIFLYAPIATLIAFSFNESRSRGVWGGFSLKWYESLFQNREILRALNNTMLIAAISALAATAIGTAAALGVNSMKKKPRKIFLAISNIPVLNPEIVTGVSLMLFFLFTARLMGRGGLGFVTLLLAHITFNIPYVMLSVLPKIRALDSSVYEAARDLGATSFTAFWKVVFPQLLPGVVTGFIFAFTLSLDDFVISFFTRGAGVSTLSIYIYTSAARRGVNPEINALSTLMFVVLLLLLFVINWRDARELKKNIRNRRKDV
ncbi:MAG: ABC transporter permease [Defluviitaleaceae bacterium]|nr:ABC transporter permease [Defluviitaleaceae bacterium]MCL2837254.1 ABC transporter permease [Defluviitaleaceae bacterium]